jgi:hypothetical protein
MLMAQLEGPLERFPKPFMHNQRPFVVRPETIFSYVHYEAGTMIVLYFISYVQIIKSLQFPNGRRFS